ncbi:alpha-mannosidase [Saccharothrix xinjiangensis]|uniref:Alpha-mannosidase n=1 Tax=Saccharothrix xinjiangensis TaxID=204798 RepID=A0ABV9Y0R6_9PSEU
MHDDRVTIEQHIERTLLQRIWPAQYRKSVDLKVSLWETPDHNQVLFKDAITKTFQGIDPGTAWGKPWRTGWFKVETKDGLGVPKTPDWQGKRVEVHFDPGYLPEHTGFGAEGLAYTGKGIPIKGLNRRTAWVLIAREAKGGEAVQFYVEAAANPLIYPPLSPFGDHAVPAPYDKPLYLFQKAQLRVFDQQVWELAHDVEVLLELMLQLGLDSPRRWEILRALQRSADALDPQNVSGTAQNARNQLGTMLSRPAHASAHLISAVGHSHLDTAWMWPYQETHRKILRTVANAVSLMDEHPDYTFVMSQAQQLEWLKTDSPELYKRVKDKVTAKQFFPIGGMWVEADTNMPSGESLVRQFTYGKHFYDSEFDLNTEEVWLPDSFGYSAALPQIIDLSGSKWLFTQKMCWNDTNVFPHHTFLWEGIDGTRVFTHATPANMYEAKITGRELHRAVRNFAEKGSATRSLLAYGYSDGGGGPTREHLGRARRLADLEGSPKVTLDSPRNFFEKAEAEYQSPPVWYGEQYLERHRGTYTSQAEIKGGNRECEALLREAELWCATAKIRKNHPYPYAALDRIWKSVLLNQFHDVLPGTSIPWVHREAVKAFEDAAKELRTIVEGAQKKLVEEFDGTFYFNSNPHPWQDVAALGARAERTPEGKIKAVPKNDKTWVMESATLRVVVDSDGLLSSLYDLSNERELIPAGQRGNLLQLHQDLPVLWDAWDIENYYRNTVVDLVTPCEVTSLANDEGVKVVRTFGAGSEVTQELRLVTGMGSRLEVTTQVNWKEVDKLLKLSFPLDVQTERSAAETQFGHVFRPTHTNTSWDAARFEICAHRWLHVGEAGYGVLLANKTTYGHDVTRRPKEDGGTSTTVRVSLLRASRWPDHGSDHGEHHFRHVLAVNAGIPDAVRESYRLHHPLRRVVVSGASTPTEVKPLVGVSDNGVVIDTVKLSDNQADDVIVRLYEAYGTRRSCSLSASFTVASACITDLLEANLKKDLDVTNDAVTLEFRPFQVITVRLHRS